MPGRCLLYYVTDRTQFPGDESARRHTLFAKIAEAARAGVDYVQLREKDLSTRELEALARELVGQIATLRTENRELRTRLLINSRTDISLTVGADGVHLRSDDVSPRDVRHLISRSGHWPLPTSHFLTAASCHTPADVVRAASEGADFTVFAPVFEKKDRPGIPPAGLNSLREACKAKISVLALGGVTLENAALCLEAGAAGVAGIRLFQENRIEDVVRALSRLGQVKSEKSN